MGSLYANTRYVRVWSIIILMKLHHFSIACTWHFSLWLLLLYRTQFRLVIRFDLLHITSPQHNIMARLVQFYFNEWIREEEASIRRPPITLSQPASFRSSPILIY